jgi:hypothetical protein
MARRRALERAESRAYYLDLGGEPLGRGTGSADRPQTRSAARGHRHLALAQSRHRPFIPIPEVAADCAWVALTFS